MFKVAEFFLSETPTGTEVALLTCALAGTFFFVLKVLMTVFSGPFEGDGSHDALHGHDAAAGDGVVHGDHHGGDHHGGAHHDAFDAFKLLSVNSIASFFMMFGWAGLSAYVQFKLNIFLSILIATAVGGATMMLTGYLFSLLGKLTSEGSVFKIEDTVGKQAEVYERIPATGRGKVQITLDGMLRELEAESRSGVPIDSFTIVKITGLRGHGGVVVEPVSVK